MAGFMIPAEGAKFTVVEKRSQSHFFFEEDRYAVIAALNDVMCPASRQQPAPSCRAPSWNGERITNNAESK